MDTPYPYSVSGKLTQKFSGRKKYRSPPPPPPFPDLHNFRGWRPTEKNVPPSLPVTLIKIHCIKLNPIWTLISYSSPYEGHLRNQMVACAK